MKKEKKNCETIIFVSPKPEYVFAVLVQIRSVTIFLYYFFAQVFCILKEEENLKDFRDS